MNTGRDQEENPVVTLSSSPSGSSRIFGKFRLLANLGAGGMGEVFLALSRSSVAGVNKLIVIKRLRHFAEDEVRSSARQMFLNEARLATLLNHPNIVQTNDVGVEDGHLFLTMEYLEGQPLNTIVRSARTKGTKLSDALYVRIVSDSLAGLHYAHELRDYDGKPLSIVHRDLSPHNLFVTYEGVAKVVNFGIAKSAGSSKTDQGIIKGKFAYMAPEQASDEKVNRRADVFVMGIVLWELLTGERLIYRRNDVQTVNRLLNDKLPPPSSVRPDLTPELDAIVMKALAKDPALRYQTARQMREALEDYLLARSHVVRQEEIGPVISDLFEEERKVMRLRIRQCIATAPEDAGMDNLPALSANESSMSTPNARQNMTPLSKGTQAPLSGTLAAMSSGAENAQVEAAPPAQWKRVPVLLAAATVAGALMAVAVYGATRSHTAQTAAPEQAQAGAVAGAVAGPEKGASPAPPAETAPAPAPTSVAVAPATATAPIERPAPRSPSAWHGSTHSAPPPIPHPQAAPPPPPPTSAPPPPPATPAPTATTHPRVFNTSF